jgi:hypothetical protein
LAAGKEQLSFYDIDNLIKQVYCEESKLVVPNKFLKSVSTGLQLFFNGNTHTINFEKMLNFLSNKDPMNEGFLDISDKLNFKPRSFREYYSLKAEKKGKTEENSNIDVSEKEYDHLTHPNYLDYWKVSLN